MHRSFLGSFLKENSCEEIGASHSKPLALHLLVATRPDGLAVLFDREGNVQIDVRERRGLVVDHRGQAVPRARALVELGVGV